MRAENGSPLTVNTFERSLIRFEGVQLHLGLGVVDISPDVLLGHPFLQKHNPIIDWTHEAYACVYGIVLMLCER